MERWPPAGERFRLAAHRNPATTRKRGDGSPPYPIALTLEGWPCLVVGGGAVARRKAGGLIRSGAVVTVVAPEVDENIRALAVKLQNRPFEPEDVVGMRLAFACTDSSAVNEAVVNAARALGVWVHRADGDGDFAGMTAVHRGELVIAIGTHGLSPAVARWMGRHIEEQFGAEYGALLDLAASLRDEVMATLPPSARASAWEAALDSDALELIRLSDPERALAVLRHALGLSEDGPPKATKATAQV